MPAVLNLAFTGNKEEHETTARETWAGALCVVEFARSEAELMQIQREFGDENDFGLDVTYSSIDVNRNLVDVGVVAAEEETLDAIDERYGDGAVEVDPALKPI